MREFIVKYKNEQIPVEAIDGQDAVYSVKEKLFSSLKEENPYHFHNLKLWKTGSKVINEQYHTIFTAYVPAPAGSGADWSSYGSPVYCMPVHQRNTLTEHLRQAGHVKSPAKTNTSRANGQKGGKPRKYIQLTVLQSGKPLAVHSIYFLRKGSEIPGFAIVADKTGYYSIQQGLNGYQFWPANKNFSYITDTLSYGLECEKKEIPW